MTDTSIIELAIERATETIERLGKENKKLREALKTIENFANGHIKNNWPGDVREIISGIAHKTLNEGR